MQYITDSAATFNMTPDVDGLSNYRECSRPLGLPNGGTTSIAGYGDLTVAFRFDNGWMHVNLHDVAHTPLLSYNLIPLPCLALKRYTYSGDKYGIAVKLKGGKTVPYRPKATGRMVNIVCAAIAPGQAKTPTTLTDINIFHCTYGRIHEVLLKKRRSSKESTSAGNSTSAGMFNYEGATEAHRQVNAHQSRYPLPLPRPRSNCPLLSKRESLQRGRARAGRAS